MTRILHIAGSPNASGSRSRAVAAHFLHHFMQRRAAVAHELDIWNKELPPFDAEMVAAKFAVLGGQDASREQRSLWERAVVLAREFNAADVYLLSVPMWNFSVPYRLKHYMDVVALPGENWRWSASEGYVPLLENKKAVVIYSSAGEYPLDLPDARDHQKALVRQWLAFVGVTDLREINVAPTAAGPQRLEQVLQDAKRAARELAIDL